VNPILAANPRQKKGLVRHIRKALEVFQHWGRNAHSVPGKLDADKFILMKV
jgi:hypothetical protein